MDNFKRALAVAVLQALACVPAQAQEYHGYRGVFEGFTEGQAAVRTDTREAFWLVDQYTRYSNGRPFPGDWVHVEVDPYNRAVDFVIEEHSARLNAIVDHIEGLVVVVRTEHGVEVWNEVPTTWHIGVAPGGLLPGDSIDVGVFRNGNLAYLRLQGHAITPPPPPEVGGPMDSGDTVQAQVAPPPLPDYVVPPCPEPDYIWTPGYWHWGPAGYYWVPGVWVAPPAPGLLWTPAYWAFVGGIYLLHAGYWGSHVGYYGGIAYGAGYYGEGFVGARWDSGHVVYNTAAVPVNTTVIHNTYVNNTVVINNRTTTINNIVNNTSNRQTVSFSGTGGARATPTTGEQQWAHEAHVKPTAAQLVHIQAARANPQLNYSVNQGKPSVLAVLRPMSALHPIGPTQKGPGSNNGALARSAHPQTQQPRRPQPQSEPRAPTMSSATNPPVTQPHPAPLSKSSPEPHSQPQAHPAKNKKHDEKKEGEKKEDEERR